MSLTGQKETDLAVSQWIVDQKNIYVSFISSDEICGPVQLIQFKIATRSNTSRTSLFSTF